MWEGLTGLLQKALLGILRKAGAALLERAIEWIENEVIPTIKARIDELD